MTIYFSGCALIEIFDPKSKISFVTFLDNGDDYSFDCPYEYIIHVRPITSKKHNTSKK